MRAWGPAVAWAAVLFLLSAWPDLGVPSFFGAGDKIAHAGLYAVLGANLGYGRYRTAAPSHLVLIAVGALYGATDEWHQAYVPGRIPDLGDWFADVAGVLIGYTALLFLLGWLAQRAPKQPDTGTDVSS